MANTPKINLLVIPDLFPKFKGDVQGIFVVDYLKSVLPYCNITVLFVRLLGNKRLTTEKADDFTVYRYCVSSKKISKFFKPFLYLVWFIKGYQVGKKIRDVDVIHSHGTILSGTLSWLLSRKLKVPFIITEHQGPFSMISASFWKRAWAKAIMQRATVVLTVSEHLKQEILTSGIFPKSIVTTYNPVDTDLFQPKSMGGGDKKILFAGRLDNFKGAFRCVKAFEKIAIKYPEWTFTIIGEGEDYLPIQNYLRQHNMLQNKIILKGKKTKAEIAEEMQHSDFFVFPSIHESFGLVIAEAMSCGLPVIVGNETAPKEYVSEESGILVSPNDIDAIAEAMEKMINNLSMYDSQLIRNKVVENFGFESFGKKLLDIYTAV